MTVTDSAEDLFETSSATFSTDRVYRYSLTRTWSFGGDAPLVFVMCNPSTADAWSLDPTVFRCRKRAELGGYGGLTVLNLFGLRSTDPAPLLTHPDPVGPDNDRIIADVIAGAGDVVVAWGAIPTTERRAPAVLNLIRSHDITALCLGVTSSGAPRHPLYVSFEQGFVPYPS